MRRRITRALLLFTGVILLAANKGCGQASSDSHDVLGGGTVVRVPDGSTHCINYTTDQVWLTLRRMIVTRKSGWLMEQKSVSVFLAATLQDGSQKPPKFPLTTQANIASYTKGQVSVPVEYGLLQGFKLSQGDESNKANYTGIAVDLTILNQQGKTKWGSALTSLDQIASKLPVPPNPYSKGIQYVLDFANSAVENDIKNQANDDKIKSATLTLNFAPNGQCPPDRDFESTGTLAIVDQNGLTNDPGYVKQSDIPAFCFKADFKPAFFLWGAPKEKEKDCTDATYKPNWKPVANNYVAFFLNAVPVTGHLGPEADEAKEEAIARCRIHGIDDASQCLQVK
jgi:hypothetical protein